MGVECYDCCICGDNGINSSNVARCEYCEEHICYKCLETADEQSSMFGEDGLLSEYCPNCKDIENNKYVYVVLFKEKDIMDFTTISTVELFHNEIKAKERQAELINEYYLKKNNGKEYTGKRELFKTIGMKYGADCWIEKREII